jgi:hypothetical protein
MTRGYKVAGGVVIAIMVLVAIVAAIMEAMH